MQLSLIWVCLMLIYWNKVIYFPCLCLRGLILLDYLPREQLRHMMYWITWKD